MINTLEISGEVNKPGIYPYSNNLSLSDLIIFAGGLEKMLHLNNIEISRLKSSGKMTDKNAELLNMDIDNLIDESIEIKPFDNIIITKRSDD